MINTNVWYEKLYDNFGQYFIIDKILYQETTDHQSLLIFENKKFGRVMTLNGIIQTTEHDEFIYHEMASHVPLIAHSSPKTVLIIGGGDGGVLREVTRHLYINEIFMIEIDEKVINTCKEYLPNHNAGSFNDSRLNLIIEDGSTFVANTTKKFDIIISDCTDPIGPGKKLFDDNFYKNCARCLNVGGIFIAQNGVDFYQKKEIVNSYHKLCQYFIDVSFYQAVIPTYYGGSMTFAWASQDYLLRQTSKPFIESRIKNTGIIFKYYNSNIHKSCFVLPQYLLDYLPNHFNI